MKTAHRYALLAAIAVCAAPALAQDSATAAPQIYQQRTADGRVVLTDRPLDGAQTQRTWAVWHEDPGAARERSEKLRLEAQAVSERIQRRIDLQEQRADQIELDRLRLSLAEARRDAEIAREAVLDTPVVLLPRAARRLPSLRPLRPTMRPVHLRPGWMRPRPQFL
jgi:hypothetical protein